MAPIVASTEISKPPDEVFEYVTDPSRLPEWQAPPSTSASFERRRRVGRYR